MEQSVVNFNHRMKKEINQLKEVGITYFSYGIKDSRGNVISFFTNSEWGEIYASNKFFLDDPCVRTSILHLGRGILWDAVPIQSKAQYELMQKRAQLCQINTGLTFARAKETHLEIIAAGSELNPSGIFFYYRTEIIKNLGDAFYEILKSRID